MAFNSVISGDFSVFLFGFFFFGPVLTMMVEMALPFMMYSPVSMRWSFICAGAILQI